MQISVEDAPTLKDFLKNARKTWRAAHTQQQPPKGRPDEKDRVFKEIESILARSNRQPSQGQLVRELDSSFRKKLSIDTLRKYAKMHRLYHTDPKKITDAELAWMTKHQKTEALEGRQLLYDVRIAVPRGLSDLQEDISNLGIAVRSKLQDLAAKKSRSRKR